MPYLVQKASKTHERGDRAANEEWPVFGASWDSPSSCPVRDQIFCASSACDGGTGCNRLQRDWFHALPIRLGGVLHVIDQRTTCHTPKVQSVLDCHRRAFNEHISGYTGLPIHIDLKANATHISARHDLFL